MCDYLSLFIHGFTETHLDALCHLPVAEGERHVERQAARPVRHARRAHAAPSTSGATASSPAACSTTSRGCAAPTYVDAGRTGARLGARRRRRRAGRRAPQPATRCSSAAATGRTSSHRRASRASAAPPGVHASCIEFLHDTEAAMLVWDMQDAPTADQGIPNPRGSRRCRCTCTTSCIPYMGMPILDNADFEALAAACADAGRWEFQFVVAPLVIPRGTGSPVNPLAIL